MMGFAALASAQDGTVEVIPLTVANSSDNTWFGAIFTEKMIMSEPGNEKITLEFDFDTRCNNKYDDWGDGTWIENYVTWETKTAGEWRSVTCSAKYMKDDGGFAKDVKIGNYIGEPVSQKGENPNAITIPEATHTLFERTDDDQDYYQFY